jgi:hypothetical protein
MVEGQHHVLDIVDTSGSHHCFEIISHAMVETSPCRSFVSTILSQFDGYLKYESRETLQDNEALWSMLMVMSGPYCFGLSSVVNNFFGMKILSPNTIHMNSMHGSHPICYFPFNSFYQFYGSNGRFYDIIEACLDELYSSNAPMNYQCHIFNMVNKFYHASIFPLLLCLYSKLCL